MILPLLSVSVTTMLTGESTALGGVPRKRPLGESVSQLGRPGAVKTYPRPEPPVGVNCWLNGSPAVATGNVTGLITSAGSTVSA
jgi:hypothetical protein